MNINKHLKIEKDKYGYSIENCDVVITLKDNQVIKGKYDSVFGFMTSWWIMVGIYINMIQ